MVALSFAAVPLYNWFCRTTGFGGTTQVSTIAPSGGRPAARSPSGSIPMSAPGLPWKFEPEVTSMRCEARRGGDREISRHQSRGAGDGWYRCLQCRAAHRRCLLPEDQLFLLHRSAREAGRKGGYDGCVLCRSCACQGSRAERSQHASRCPTRFTRCANRNGQSRAQRGIACAGAAFENISNGDENG